ncbi:MAG: ATP-binding protein [bacterium]
MSLKVIFKKVNKTISVKFFVISALFILFIFSVFTAHFIQRQNKFLRESLISKGKILSKVLAYDSRLGVFSENEALLADSINAILQEEEILDVSIYNSDGRLLKRKKRQVKSHQKEDLYSKGENLEKVFAWTTTGDYPLYMEDKNNLEFWAPVIEGPDYALEESVIFHDVPLSGENRVIGFVVITIGKGRLKKGFKALLYNSILLGIIFLLAGSLVFYLLIRGITGPLKRLTDDVISFGKEGTFGSVSVETEDEIGRLARAFNYMAESLKKREAEKEQLGEQLRHSQKMEAIGTLAGGIAHDFNNILTSMIGYAQMMDRKMSKNNPFRYEVKNVLDSGKKAARLTKSILAYSRKQPMDPRPVDLNELVCDIQKLLSGFIRENIECNLNISEQNMIAMADPVQIEQVMLNLATNAMDAMPDGGVLNIITESATLDKNHFGEKAPACKGRYALIRVMDTGTGMDNQTMRKIFDPFFTTKEVGKGTGIGLSMAYGIIKQHHGYIDVNSSQGRGTEFRIYLPLIDLSAERKKGEHHPVLKRGTETVLLAEDDEVVRRFAKDTLQEHGYTVIDAADGNDAIRNFIEYKDSIRLLIFDVVMPKKNGREAYEHIKNIKPDIRVLFLSGYDYNILHKQGVSEKGINFIAKPVSEVLLLKKVREVLDS